MSKHCGHFYVGPDLVCVGTIEEALRIAVELMPEKRLGDCVSIYKSKRARAQVHARVKVLIEKGTGKIRYVYFADKNKYGHTVRIDYSIDRRSKWCNAAF